MATDPFGGDKELAEVFFASVRMARDLAAERDHAFMPFAIGRRGEEDVMNSFPIPPEEVVETATRICRESDFSVWALVWDGIVQIDGVQEDALRFRVARSGEDRILRLYWRYTRVPTFSLVANPGVIS